MDGCMYVWMGVWVTGGCMGDRWVYVWMDECMDGWMYRWMGRWMYG